LLRRILAISVFLVPAALAAEPTKLGGSDIKETFTGSRIELDTPLGTTIPIQFTGDGLMTGNAGSLASVLGAQNDRGRWWVKGDRLCYKWFRWFDAEEQCLSIHMNDERVFWRSDDGKKGTATIVERPAAVVAEAGNRAVPMARPLPRAELARLALSTPVETRAPVLKSPPRLVVRQKSAAEQLNIPDEAPTDRSLFFVGLGLSHALQSQFGIATAQAAEIAPAAKPLKKVAAKSQAAPLKKVVANSTLPPSPPAPANSHPQPDDEARLPAASMPVSFNVYGVSVDDVLNMRSGPSEDYAIVGVIPPNGSAVRMIGGCIGLWCEIQFRNTRGWVNRYYLSQN
jgi:hypothetical protein